MFFRSLSFLVFFATVFPAVNGSLHSAWAAESGSDKTQSKVLFNEAMEFYAKARAKEDDAAEKAAELFERYLESDPENAEAIAYLGSSMTMKGRDAGFVINKMLFTNAGLSKLDEAIEIAPRNFLVRFIRANVNSAVPAFFFRDGKATEDMLVLDELYRKHPSPRLAGMMIEIYEQLMERAPDDGPWEERLKNAQEAAKREAG